MKTYFTHPFFAIALSMAAINSVYANDGTCPAPQADIKLLDFINVECLSQETLCDILEGRLPSLAIEFPEKVQLPLEMFIEGDLISLTGANEMPAKIQFNRPVYLRNVQGRLYLSSDLNSWKSFESFVKGRLQIGLKINEESGPQITFGAELYEREAE